MKNRISKLAAAGLLLVVCGGCAVGSRVRGGGASTKAAGGAVATIQQSDDPKGVSHQVSEHEVERRLTLPAGTVVERHGTNGFVERMILSVASEVVEKTRDSFNTSLGAAQRNVIGEIGEKLKRAWPIMAVGCGLLVGAAALFYFGWYTKGALAIGCAVLAFVLYYVIPLHAGAIALGCLGLFWFLALLVLYVHFYTKGDVNRNWVPDRLEKGLNAKDVKDVKDLKDVKAE